MYFQSVAAVPQRGVRGGSVVPLLDGVNCRGNESNLLGCSHDGISQRNCSSSFDAVAGVVCGGKYD